MMLVSSRPITMGMLEVRHRTRQGWGYTESEWLSPRNSPLTLADDRILGLKGCGWTIKLLRHYWSLLGRVTLDNLTRASTKDVMFSLS